MDKNKITRSGFFIAVHISVINDGKVLLGCRQNTGWYDGYYDSPGGHLEVGESVTKAITRELFEETSLRVDEINLKLFHITHYIGTKPYLYLFFRTDQYSGTIKNNEPEFMRELAFYPIDILPSKTTPYARAAIENIDSTEVTYSYFEGSGPNEP